MSESREYSQIKNDQEINRAKLRAYPVKKGEGIFRVFVNLGINFKKDTQKDIEKIGELLMSKSGLKEGDIFILDSDFNIHVKRNGAYLLHYPLINIQSKAQEKDVLKSDTSDKLRELVDQLDQQNRLKYYTEVVLEKDSGGSDITDDDVRAMQDDIKKDEEAEMIKEKFKAKIDSKNKNKDIYHNKEKLALKKKEKAKKTKTAIISNAGRKKLIDHIERINKKFVNNYKFVEEMAGKYSLKPALLIAVIQNDTGMGKYLISKNNVANIGNDDSGRKVHFKSPRAGIEALAKNLKKRTNSYNEKFPSRNPTVKELMTGVSRDNIKYYGPYMTKKEGPQTVAMIYDQLK